MEPLSNSIPGLNAVAMGDRKADLVFRNASVISVYTREILKGQDLAIYKGRIAYAGDDGAHTIGGRTRVVDLEGRYAAPGFADPHMHVDQFVLPSELAARLLLRGTTSIFSDPIDIVSVAGYRGFREFVRLCRDLPVRFFHMVPGGLPVDVKFSKSGSLTRREEASALKEPDVLGMGEVFSWTKVTSRDPGTMESLSAMLDAGCVINGHTAGASGRKLEAYVSSGILSCHEPIDFEQVLERLRLGMWIMMREGSIRRDLKRIIPGLQLHRTRLDRLMFCSDGLDPAEVDEFGHIDHCIREAVSHGMDPIDALTIASRNCFDYYNMAKDLGGLGPGRIADLLILDDLDSFIPRHVFVGGRCAVLNGQLVEGHTVRHISPWLAKTVRTSRFSEGDFKVKTKSRSVLANTIVMVTEIITRLGSAELKSKDGDVKASPEKDIWKVAAFERTTGTGRRTVGFLENFGAEIGAFASTWSFHENDLVVIGRTESEMAAAANALVESRGGMVVTRDGKIASIMPLQAGGIISTDPFEKVLSNFRSLTDLLADAGCRFKKPHLMPLFLPFLALPSVRILSGGMVDVRRRRRLPVLIRRTKDHSKASARIDDPMP